MALRFSGPAFSIDTVRLAHDFDRVDLRLGRVLRPIGPLVEGFAAALRKSIDADFQVGGREPFPWAPNRPNTIAAKGHGRVLEGKRGARLRKAVRVETTASGDQSYTVSVYAPFPGSVHQWGAPGPWTIRPKKAGGFLVFPVAEDRSEFNARRKKALGRRRAGENVRVPATPARKLVFVKQVTHPGLPQRKFVVVRPGLLREGWYRPASKFLVGGVS